MPQVSSESAVFASLGSSTAGLDASIKRDAYEAAEAYVADRCVWADSDGQGSVVAPPAALVQAVKLLTARFLARRNSPDGTIGMGDLGVVRVGGTDRDVDRLIAPYRRVVLA